MIFRGSTGKQHFLIIRSMQGPFAVIITNAFACVYPRPRSQGAVFPGVRVSKTSHIGGTGGESVAR